MRSLALLLALFAASAGMAADFSGLELFIPVISRVPGANATQWRTDLVISNRSEFESTTVRFVYRQSGNNTPTQSSVTIPARGSATIPDVLEETFGRIQSYGTLWLGSSNDQARIVAHARIYNVGNAAGEFGQVVQALPLDQIGKKVWLNGIIGIRGNRTNIGIGNPNSAVAKYSLKWYDKTGNLQGTFSNLTIEPWDVQLFNDIFVQLNSGPDEGTTILIQSDIPVYAYASVVRNDTGDAYTIIGNGTDE